MSGKRRARATQAVVQQRIQEIMQIRLDGAGFADIRQYVAEKEQAGEHPWTIPEGGSPLAERTLWHYVDLSNQTIKADFKESRTKYLRFHLKARRRLLARALEGNDLRLALACLDSEIRLFYQDEKNEIEEIKEKVAEIARITARIDAMDRQGEASGGWPQGFPRFSEEQNVN